MSAGYKLAALGLVAVCIALLIWYRRRAAGQSRWRGPFSGWIVTPTGASWSFSPGTSVEAAQADLQAKAAGRPATLLVEKKRGVDAAGYWWAFTLPSEASVAAKTDLDTWQYWILDPVGPK